MLDYPMVLIFFGEGDEQWFPHLKNKQISCRTDQEQKPAAPSGGDVLASWRKWTCPYRELIGHVMLNHFINPYLASSKFI